jgi:hypothetical protein
VINLYFCCFSHRGKDSKVERPRASKHEALSSSPSTTKKKKKKPIIRRLALKGTLESDLVDRVGTGT